jgi:exodeoxyribonuclease V alpha subunit
MERVVSKRLIELNDRNNRFDNNANEAYLKAVGELPYELTKKQSGAVLTSLDNSVSCITGGAGTGKTTVLRTTLSAFHSLNYDIHAIALSGRAAMRLNESIGFETSTIARFLKNAPLDDKSDESGESKKLQLLVIDEASMIDIPTMYRLVTHISPSVRILLVGDPNQLPPIGCGKVLSDIAESNVIANTELDIVKRQKGSTGIPEYSKSVNNGLVPDKLSTGNIFFHENTANNIADKCCELYTESDADSRVVAPTKKLVSEINKIIQSTQNSDGKLLEFELYGENRFLNIKLGDAVLFTKNHYDLGVQNGSLGTLTSVTPFETESEDSSQKASYFGKITLDTGEEIGINEDILDCIELGYAITLHKAQGSQFPRIIIALKSGKIVDRAWLYTAITRAETEVHIVGSQKDLRAIIENPSNASKRNSHLVRLLKEKADPCKSARYKK